MHKKVLSLCLGLLLVSSASNTYAAAPQTLAWRDLVNHPERWPAKTKITINFNVDRDAFKSGMELKVHDVKAATVDLLTPQGYSVSLKHNETTLLEDANAFWASLTPEQREITWPKIAADRTLWPARIILPSGASFSNLELEPGTEAMLLSAEGNSVLFTHPKGDGVLSINYTMTDIITRARDLAALPVEERPGILPSVFEGRLLDADGQPRADKPAKYYLVYYAASTCPRCAIFSPKFVDYYNKTLAGRDDVEIIVWATEKPKTNILPYMRNQGMLWAAINNKEADIAGAAFSKKGTVTQIPAIIVMDRFGNELLSSRTYPEQTIAKAELALEQLNQVIGE